MSYAVILRQAFVLASILTPPDAMTQIIMTVPLIILYELSIVLARILGKKRKIAEDHSGR